MPKFIFIRHGQTEMNAQSIQQGWQDSPLTDLGRQQAYDVKAQLDLAGATIISSDLGRAQETTRIIISDQPAVDVLYDWRLRERSYGEFEGQPIDSTEIDRTFANENESYRGAEPLAQFSKRVLSFLDDCRLLDSDRFIVITHNGVLNRLHYLLLNQLDYKNFDNGGAIVFDIDLSTHPPTLLSDSSN